ncbi:MerR family transcriptional regulator [Microvirga sp. TS319]|uniref:MerR family transcriptional regulator n=1 Tax=Microvirga sp. TS319 TaxID=3241165 RepID=UPI003519DCB8
MSSSARFLTPSQAAKRLRVSTKALRLYEQRGLVAPIGTAAGWRAWMPTRLSSPGWTGHGCCSWPRDRTWPRRSARRWSWWPRTAGQCCWRQNWPWGAVLVLEEAVWSEAAIRI